MSDRGVETRPRPSRRWLLRLLLVLIVGCVALSIWLYQLPGRSSQQPGNPSAETSSASEITPEELAARINHDTIAAWVAQCLEVPNFHTLPLPYLALFDTGNYRPYNETPVNPKRALLNNQEHEVISLSKIIYVQRSNLDKSVKSMATSWINFQWIIIIVGFLTSALVSINAIDIWKIETKIGKAIRILAVVFPAVGTAMAATSAIYPREELVRNSNVLANLGQLHNQISIEVWSLQCNATNDPKSNDPNTPWAKNAAKIDAWVKRQQQVLSPAQPSSSTSASPEVRPPDERGVRGSPPKTSPSP